MHPTPKSIEVEIDELNQQRIPWAQPRFAWSLVISSQPLDVMIKPLSLRIINFQESTTQIARRRSYDSQAAHAGRRNERRKAAALQFRASTKKK